MLCEELRRLRLGEVWRGVAWRGVARDGGTESDPIPSPSSTVEQLHWNCLGFD